MDDREMHVKAADRAAADATERLKRTSEENAKAALEQPANPVRTSIEILMMADGTFHMNGPWQDQILFRGLMDIARSAMDKEFARLTAELMKKNAGRIQAIQGVPQSVVDQLRTKGA